MTDTSEEREFDALLDYLQRARGFQFGAYKRPSLMRRMNKRVRAAGLETFADYMDYLEVHPEEFAHLFDTVLINVTSFFRDDQSWEALNSEVIPRIIGGKKPDDRIRVWCAGVASGEEVYTLAMLLAEALGAEEFQQRVKIYATDIDENALNEARQGNFTEKKIEPVPIDFRKKYFEQTDSRYTFRKDLRRSVIFGRHDLHQDAPISRVDLLVCRNTLMYFNAEAQARILLHFHFALNDDGILFLGKSEMLLTHTNIFTPLDLKRRIFTKVPKVGLRDHLLMMAQVNNQETANHMANNVSIREVAFDNSAVPLIVVDHDGCLVLANQQARSLFGINIRDLGRPLKDLEISYRPLELRSRVEQAFAEHRIVNVSGVEWRVGQDEKRYLDVQIMPITSSAGILIGVTVAFTDVTRYKVLQLQLEHSRIELASAYEEVQSTNEELETTNEELQSTNEELETLNEELQSTNEELETMNEELQSTNEELEATNEEMRQRTDELYLSNDFMESILRGLRVGVIVVDNSMRIQAWNQKSEELWGLRETEAQGQNLLNLDIGLPVERLKQPVRASLAGDKDGQAVTVSATNRRGKSIECRVSCTPLHNQSDGIRGAILLVEDTDGHKL